MCYVLCVKTQIWKPSLLLDRLYVETVIDCMQHCIRRIHSSLTQKIAHWCVENWRLVTQASNCPKCHKSLSWKTFEMYGRTRKYLVLNLLVATHHIKSKSEVHISDVTWLAPVSSYVHTTSEHRRSWWGLWPSFRSRSSIEDLVNGSRPFRLEALCYTWHLNTSLMAMQDSFQEAIEAIHNCGKTRTLTQGVCQPTLQRDLHEGKCTQATADTMTI